MMSTPSPTASRTVRISARFFCMPSAPSVGPQPKRSFIALYALSLYFLYSRVCISLRFARELLQRRAEKPAGIDENFGFRAPAEQAINRLFRGFAENVPHRDVHRTDGDHADAFAAKRHGLAIHVLPEKFDIPRVLPDEQWLEDRKGGKEWGFR